MAWEGDDFSARGVRLRPTTPSGRRPPVWVGGNSRAAIRRAARYEGWAPFYTGGYEKASRTAAIESVDDLAAAIGVVRGLRTDPQAPFDICWSEPALGDRDLSTDERCSRVEALAEVGVTWIAITIPGDDRQEILEGIEAFGRTVVQAEVGA